MNKTNHVPITDFVDIRDDLRKPINSTERNKRIGQKSQNELYPYYGATGQVGWIDHYITDGEYVLVGEDGAPFFDRTKEKAYIISGKSWVNNHAHILIAKEKKSLNQFIKYYLNFFNYEGYVNGTTRLKLTKGSLQQIPIPNFSFIVQKSIVKKLDSIYQELEIGRNKIENAKCNLSYYKQSILNSAIQGRFVPQDPKDEPASKLLERIKKEKEKLIAAGKIKKEKSLTPISKDEIPFELPEGWEWVRLGDIVPIGTGGTPLKSNKGYYQNGNIPWLTSSVTSENYVTEATKFITKKALEETNCKLFPKGTLLIAMYGEGKTRGQITELKIEATTNQALAAILFDESSNALKDFIKIIFMERYEKIRMEAMGGNQPNLSTGTIKNQIIPIPPLKEQIRIVEAVNQALDSAKNLNDILEDNLNKSELLKQSILKKAFEGEL